MTYPTYFEALDHQQILADYPIGDAFTARYSGMSRDELFAIQDAQFRKLMQRGWQVPFYRRLWGAKGIEPGDIRGLADITKLPVYDKSDLMASIAEYPPFGDFHGMGDAATRAPSIFHTTSGTTGKPQTLIFGPKGREVGNLLVGRMYRWMGLEPSDVVHSVYGHGMINGGHYIREAVTHFTNSVFLSAGTGIETRSVNQVRLMADFGATAIVGFVDYIRKLAETAEAEGLFDKINIRMIIGHLGTEDRASTEAAWHGAKAYDWYGVGDTGSIAGEGPERDGMYVWEDAQYLELLDIDSGAPVVRGATGTWSSPAFTRTISRPASASTPTISPMNWMAAARSCSSASPGSRAAATTWSSCAGSTFSPTRSARSSRTVPILPENMSATCAGTPRRRTT